MILTGIKTTNPTDSDWSWLVPGGAESFSAEVIFFAFCISVPIAQGLILLVRRYGASTII